MKLILIFCILTTGCTNFSKKQPNIIDGKEKLKKEIIVADTSNELMIKSTGIDTSSFIFFVSLFNTKYNELQFTKNNDGFSDFYTNRIPDKLYKKYTQHSLSHEQVLNQPPCLLCL